MNDTLVEAIVNYSQLCSEAMKPVVATWRSYFIERCAHWCVYIETELLAMSDARAEACRQKAIELSSTTIPELSTLMNALRYFCTTLLENPFVNNELYWMVMSTYELYNPDLEPEKALLDDVSDAVCKPAILNVLDAMLMCSSLNNVDQILTLSPLDTCSYRYKMSFSNPRALET